MFTSNRPATTTQSEFVAFACDHIKQASAAAPMGAERHKHLQVAASDLEAAREYQLAALIRDIDENRAYPSLLPFLRRKLIEQYHLPLTLQ